MRCAREAAEIAEIERPRVMRTQGSRRRIRARAPRWRSIRLRLTLLNFGLLTVVLLGLVAGQYLFLRHLLLDQTASLLRAEARPTIDGFLNGPKRGTDLGIAAGRLATNLSSQDTSGLILGPQQTILGRPDTSAVPSTAPSAPPDPARVRLALTGNRSVTYETVVHGVPALVALVPLQSQLAGVGIIGVAQLTTPLTSVDATLRNLVLIDIGGMLIVLLVAIALAPAVASIALAPLRQMVGAAERLGEGDLRQRVLLRHGDDEAGQLAEAMNQMAERLEVLFAAQRQFVSDASHELRTPLTIVRSSLELLLLQAEEEPARVLQILRSAHKELTRMSRLVVNLLDLARIDAGVQLNLGRVDLANVARAACDEAREIDPDHPLLLDESTGPCVRADGQRVAQITRNFLDNARKFTPSAGRISVRTGSNATEGWIEVEDTGIGIAQQHQAQIFQRFYRIDESRSRELGGAGLGLAIASALAEAQHGRIELASSPGEGARFRLVLPLD